MRKKTKAESSYPRLEWRELSTLKAHPDSMRNATPADIFTAGKALKHFGFLRPPFVVNDRTGELLDGDQLLGLARQEGLKTVPVWVIDIAPEDEDVAHLALNNHIGEWRWYDVAEVLKAVDKAGRDTALAGFPQWIVKPMLGASWRPGVLGAPGAEDPNQVKLL